MKRPVFIIGCPRSGTTLLYDMLQSAGGFARYPAESNVFSMLVPTFGNFKSQRNKRSLMEAWLKSHLFRVSRLDSAYIEPKLMQTRSGGEFLRVLMDEIARSQNVDRWAEQTPSHVYHVPEIRNAFPDALFVHMIRDGRDVALSLGKPGWIKPLPGQSHNLRVAAALFWAWTVRKGRAYRQTLRSDYLEIRYEDLVQSPHDTLRHLGRFIEHDLDYDRILEKPFGSVKKPNTSFAKELASEKFSPVSRWRRALDHDGLATLEYLIGELLAELGYPLGTDSADRRQAGLSLLRALYPAYYDWLIWVKRKTPVYKYFAGRDLDHRMFHAAYETVDYVATQDAKRDNRPVNE
jgi:hypothetical protein